MVRSFRCIPTALIATLLLSGHLFGSPVLCFASDEPIDEDTRTTDTIDLNDLPTGVTEQTNVDLYAVPALNDDGSPKPYEANNQWGLTQTQWDSMVEAQQNALNAAQADARQAEEDYNANSASEVAEGQLNPADAIKLAYTVGAERNHTVPQSPCIVPFNGAVVLLEGASEIVGGENNTSAHLHCTYSRVAGATTTNPDTVYVGGLDASCIFQRNCYGHRRRHSCFDPESKIQMGDRTWREIQAIKEGELVWSPSQQKPVKVLRVVAGPEQTALIEIGYGERKLRVTQNHPMVTAKAHTDADDVELRTTAVSSFARDRARQEVAFSVRKAGELGIGSMIMTEDGTFQPITYFHQLPLKEDQVVYNLTLEGEKDDPTQHLVIADGIVTGDFELQQVMNKTLSQ